MFDFHILMHMDINKGTCFSHKHYSGFFIDNFPTAMNLLFCSCNVVGNATRVTTP